MIDIEWELEPLPSLILIFCILYLPNYLVFIPIHSYLAFIPTYSYLTYITSFGVAIINDTKFPIHPQTRPRCGQLAPLR